MQSKLCKRSLKMRLLNSSFEARFYQFPLKLGTITTFCLVRPLSLYSDEEKGTVGTRVGVKQCRRQRLPFMLTSSLSRSQLNYIVMQCTIKMHNDTMCFVLCRLSGRGLAQARRPKLSSKTCISVLSKAKFLDFSAQTVLARRLL